MTTGDGRPAPGTNLYTELVNSYAARHFYGRHADLRLLETGLNGPTPRSFALVGGPKLGKTALLLQFGARHAVRQAEGSPGRAVPLIYVDCYQRSADEVLDRIAVELAEQLGEGPLAGDDSAELRKLMADVRPNSTPRGEQISSLRGVLLRTIRTLARNNIYPILCLDHFGRVNLLEAAASLSLRELSANASFVIAIEPDNLETVQRNSPFLNIIFVRRIGLMPFHEAAELINAPLAEGERWNDDAVAAIFWIAGGNPYLLTMVCEELYAQKLRGSSVLAVHLQKRDERLVQDVETLPEIRRLFALVWERLSEAAQQVLAHAVRQPDGPRGALTPIDDSYRDSQAAGELRDWGLIDTDSASGDLVLCSRLFVRFVRGQEPPASVGAAAGEISLALDELLRTLRDSNEGKLLRTLRDHAGEVLSVEELRRSVWHDAPEGDRHVVDQTLSRLRRRLRENVPAGDDLIKVVRGQGYTLMLPGNAEGRRA